MLHKKFLQKDQSNFVSWEVSECEVSWESKVHILGELTIFDGDKAVFFSHNSIDSIKSLIVELEAFVKEYESVVKKHQSKPAMMKAKK